MLRRLRSEQSGFTLIEVLVGMVLGLAVCWLALDLIPTASSSSRASTDRAATTASLQTAVAGITREVRAATAAALQTPSILDLTVGVRGSTTLQHVRYDCTSGTCIRYVCSNLITGSLVNATCATPASQSQIVSGLAGTDVFAALLGGASATLPAGIAAGSSPTMNTLQLKLRVSVVNSSVPVEVDDGTAFANFSL